VIGRVRFALVAVALCVLAGCGSSNPPSTTSSTSQATGSAPATRHVQRVSVPKLVGERFGRAVKMAEQAGLRQEAPHFTGTVGNPHYNGHCQRILSQSPPPGTRVPKGTTVAIVYGVCRKAIAHGKSSTTDPAKRGG